MFKLFILKALLNNLVLTDFKPSLHKSKMHLPLSLRFGLRKSDLDSQQILGIRWFPSTTCSQPMHKKSKLASIVSPSSVPNSVFTCASVTDFSLNRHTWFLPLRWAVTSKISFKSHFFSSLLTSRPSRLTAPGPKAKREKITALMNPIKVYESREYNVIIIQILKYMYTIYSIDS